jgi:hypothetical protein
VRLSLHVAEKGPVVWSPPDSLHPTQGALPCGRLDSQPPLQLLATFSSLEILPNIESGAGDGVRAADDLRRDAPVFATCFGLFGLATCFGASTVMWGSGLAESVAVCDAAGPHSKTVDKTATAEGAIKLDDNLMTCPPNADGNVVPTSARYHTFRIRPRASKRYLPLAIDMAAENADRLRRCEGEHEVSRKTIAQGKTFVL